MRAKIFKTLKETDGFVSGESLSTALGVTRAALWKHIKAIQTDGAEIESVTGMGYRLLSPPNIPRTEYLQAYLNTDTRVVFEKIVTSTNDIAKQAAQDKSIDHAVFITGEQTAGKGRKGRSWVSLKNQGIYMSFLVRPQIDTLLVSGLTLVAAIAVCNAIEKTAGINVSIKWPNDVLIENKKVCGILTESMLGMDGIEYVVCGMGINTDQQGFEDELKDKAVSLSMNKSSVNRMLLTAAIIDAFFEGYQVFLQQGLSAFMPEFRKRSALSGEITVNSPTSRETGTLIGFDDTGAILIESNGKQKRFVAGEISLRGANGYV